MEVTLVHISDLHFKNDVENKFRANLLKDDLKRLPKAGPRIVCMTGDIVQAGDDDIYNILFDDLIGPLLEDSFEIAVVPGNHDIQRSRASRHFSDSHLSDQTSSYLFDGALSVESPHKEDESDPLFNYNQLEELFGPYDFRNYWGYRRQISDVSLIGLNSTWLSRDRPQGDSDRGKLRVRSRKITG